jgi:hypothetical protein
MSDESTVTVRADFTTRDAAERAIEHLVQEHGIARGDVFVRARDTANSAGSEKSGPDASSGPADGSAFEPSLKGSIEVSADVTSSTADTVEEVFRSAGASKLARQ